MSHSKVFNAASKYASNKQAVIEAIKVAGISPEVQVEFQLGYMTGRIQAQKWALSDHPEKQTLSGKSQTVTASQAEQWSEIILSSKGSGCKNLKANERRRTEQEETLAGQARKEWSRLLILAGLKTIEKRGANTPKAKPADPAEPKAAPKAKAKEAAPRVSTAQAALMHLKSVCADLLLFENKNADAMSLDMTKAIDSFRVAISGIALSMKEDSKKK